MRGKFYTERDIVDLIRAGARQLEMNPGDRMTDLARDRAQKEGLMIVGTYEAPFQAARLASSVRYSQQQASASLPPSRQSSDQHGIEARVASAVKAQLGEEVDHELIDRVVRRVLDQMGLS